MSGRRAPNKISLAIGISILVHILLALFFWRLSWRWDKLAATLSDAGGVIWFNLNPGGAGSGGEGGSGAPLQEELGANEAQPKPKEKEKQTPREIVQPTKKKASGPAAVALPKTQPEQPKPATEKSTGTRGPGEGEGEGSKSGSGGGSGEGLGQGEGGGSGEGKGPGGAGAIGTGGSGQGGDANAVLAKIRNKISRAKRYPRQARSEGLEGVCGLSFAIRPDGSLEFVELSKSSGYNVLDEEAVATVRRAAPFPYYAGPIRFSLRFSLKDL